MTDFSRGDKIDIRQVDVFAFDRAHTNSPGDGEWSIWGNGQGSRMSVADDELEHVVVVPGGLFAPAA